MVNGRGAVALSMAAALILSTGLFAQKKDEKKQSDAQKKEIQSAVKFVDDVAAGKPAPNDFGVKWAREDFLKAADNKEYVPFTVTIDPPRSNGNVALYWRVVAKAEAPAGDKDEKKDDKRPLYAYEDVSFIPVSKDSTRLTRSFSVPAGTYDVYVLVKEPLTKDKKAPAPRVSVLKQTVTVPEFWNENLNTSTVIVAQRIDPLPAPLTPQQQAERPYAIGSLEIVPIWDPKMSKKTELSTFMMIYNPKIDAAFNKPDVTVEYSFYTKSATGEKFFNKTAPQSLNAQTLPPAFDLAQGHQLQAGQAVPLAAFPEGDYRLEIKVTDKIANKSVTRDVNFTVTAS